LNPVSFTKTFEPELKRSVEERITRAQAVKSKLNMAVQLEGSERMRDNMQSKLVEQLYKRGTTSLAKRASTCESKRPPNALIKSNDDFIFAQLNKIQVPND
jgi:hypothetical protein